MNPGKISGRVFKLTRYRWIVSSNQPPAADGPADYAVSGAQV
jgi:hypothetical protein